MSKIEWVSLSESVPDKKRAPLVLGASQWYEKHEPEMHICVNKVEKRKDFVYLSVYNSICPPISSNEHGYWAYLPENDSKEWIPFVSEEREGDAFYENEVIVRLHNGSIYTGFIQWFGFEPSFNLFKSVPRESISHYMSLPEYPPELAEIMQKINNEE